MENAIDFEGLNQLLSIRKQEFKEGKNLATDTPIYVVLDIHKHYCSGHSDISFNTNLKGKESVHGFIDEYSDDPEFLTDPIGMTKPKEVTEFYTDRIVAFFITSNGAHDYLRYQKHNLHDAYVYVFHAGYRNAEAYILKAKS